jgi:hypothetical protein
MAARLGNVLFWLGMLIAAGWLWFGYTVIMSGRGETSAPLDEADVVTLFGIPIVSAGLGWALRYILSGR